MSGSQVRVLKIAPTVGVAVALVTAAVTLAAQPTKGSVYAGTTQRDHDVVTLTISANGKKLTASAPIAPLYCQGAGPPSTESSKPAAISKSGSFSATIVYMAEGKVFAKLLVSGRFTSKTLAKATARSNYLSLPSMCNGTTKFTAKPAGAL
jgi:hypothetical protein